MSKNVEECGDYELQFDSEWLHVLQIVDTTNERTLHMKAQEAQALLQLLDSHRDELFRLVHELLPDKEPRTCPWCKEPGTYTVTPNQTEVDLEYNAYQCPNKHTFYLKIGELDQLAHGALPEQKPSCPHCGASAEKQPPDERTPNHDWYLCTNSHRFHTQRLEAK